MASVDGVLVRRPPLDNWSVKEQLCLASAVARTGDQSWVSVARALRPLASTADRPSDWFSQKSCAAQYGALLEKCQTTRRKKRLSDGSSPSPAPATESSLDSILNRLTDDRIAELQTIMADDVKKYGQLKDEIKELTTGPITESRLRAMAAAMEAEINAKEIEAAKHVQWLQERKLLLERSERTFRRQDSETPHASPLLTSLLQSSAPVQQTASLVADNSKSPILPKSENLGLGESINTQMGNKVTPYHELQKIEQIKSELQKIEQNLIEGSISTESIVLPPLHNTAELSSKENVNAETLKTPEKIDLDDIVIKDEDVYAFSDIDLDIPPVSSIHKTPIGRTSQSDKNLFNKRELQSSVDMVDLSTSEQESLQDMNIPSQPTSLEITEAIVGTAATIGTTDFNNDNIDNNESKVLSNDEIKVESIAPNDEKTTENTDVQTEQVIIKEEVKEKEDNKTEMAGDEGLKNNDGNIVAEVVQSIETQSKVQEKETESKIEKPESSDKPTEFSESHIETDDDTPIEVIKEDKPGKTKRDYSRKKTEKDERSSPSRELDGMMGNKMEFSDEVGSDNSQELADKKILSKRFRNDLGGSRSESPATPTDSLPNSPAPQTPPCSSVNNSLSLPSDQDKDYRIWKKSVIQALTRVNTLKYASLFAKPITDEHAPGYSQAVKRPLDLSTIRRNIDIGVIRTTQEFQRDLLLMLTNALMYNRTDHRIYAMTKETIQDTISQINVLLQAQAHAASETISLSRLTRPPRPASRSAGPAVKRKRATGGSDTPTNTKKRRADDV